MRTTNKDNAFRTIQAFVSVGGRDVVVSPGSRNAPLVIGFQSVGSSISLHSVVDERSAGFYALGLALRYKRPVGLVCTSGTALLNYSPAIAEAYYLGVPLVVMSADRPEELIDTGVGQSIRQKNVFSNFQKGFIHNSEKEPIETFELVNFLSICMTDKKGPIHINLPFSEPLYDTVERNISLTELRPETPDVHKANLDSLLDCLKGSTRVLVLSGMLELSANERLAFHKLIKDKKVCHLQESTGSCGTIDSILNIDRVLAACNGAIPKPDVIITLGEHIISKRIKQVIGEFSVPHFHLHPFGVAMDVFGSLVQTLTADFKTVFEVMDKYLVENESYFLEWNTVSITAEKMHRKFLETLPFSDLGVYNKLIHLIPSSYHVHSGNSSVVRYIQLFDYQNLIFFHANRGTSGIDGSTSTAIGYAVASNSPTLLITGDLSFLYDSNALWIKNIPSSFRIIVINNNGGGIFRFIPGPLTVNNHELYFEGTHDVNIENLSKAFHFIYVKATDYSSLDTELDSFFEASDNPKILEIQTPRELNDRVLKRYFRFLTTQNEEFLY